MSAAHEVSKPSEPKSTAITATVKSLGEFIQKYQEQISGLLPKHLDPQKMVRIAQVALSRNPKLLECTPLSILDCVIKAAQVGLELNGPMRQAYMVPYWNSQAKKLEAQFQIGYPGMIELASRSREVSYVDAHPVYDSDYFQFEHGDKQFLKHKPNLERDTDDLHAAYAIIKFRDGSQMFEVLGKRDIERLKARSQMGKDDKGPWKTDESEMWRKSPIKKLLKRVRTSQELQAALGYDDQSELGLPQDSVLDFDFDSARARLATVEKTEQLKEKIGAKRSKAVQEPEPPKTPEPEPPIGDPPAEEPSQPDLPKEDPESARIEKGIQALQAAGRIKQVQEPGTKILGPDRQILLDEIQKIAHALPKPEQTKFEEEARAVLMSLGCAKSWDLRYDLLVEFYNWLDKQSQEALV